MKAQRWGTIHRISLRTPMGLVQPHKHQDSDREEVLLSAVQDSYMHSAELQKA